MAPFISSLSPVPSFPEYTGPYKVGTVDVEIPVSELESPSPAPDGSADIHTVLFRIFYPAVPESRGKRISWLPAPQRLHVAAYAQFLGAGSTLASILSFLPRHLHWTSIPAHTNATLLPPPSDRPDSRWPTMVFSHGLGGNRNAYSHLAGSLASYGVVVICPEHRDGSAALTLVRDPKSKAPKHNPHLVPYLRIPHSQTPETWQARNKQLRIRLWELGLIFDAVTALDNNNTNPPLIPSSNLNHSTPQSTLAQFAHTLDIHTPGRVIFAGHSFGAVTTVQLLKSTFYAAHPSVRAMSNPLFTPSPTSAIARQITAACNPTVLLDMWCFPLMAKETAALYALPLPCYSSCPAEKGRGGEAVLAVESQAFFRWTEHLHGKAKILSPEPGRVGAVTAAMFGRSGSGSGMEAETETETEAEAETGTERESRSEAETAFEAESDSGTEIGSETEAETEIEGGDKKKKKNEGEWSRPNFFYVTSSAHLNQSDFGVLFPWLTKRVFKSDQPERVLRLNVRAVLQFLRGNGVPVEGTRRAGLVDGGHPGLTGEWVENDEVILEKRAEGEGEVEAWRCIDVVGLGDKAGPSELEMARGGKEEEEARAEEGEREMQGEIEPSLENVVEGAAVHAAREVAV
ncbi:putative phospholipase A2 [Parachaetomium inaequale]|uniref:Putative phospholipase n=1 Tax=Parachaetomium inaequale TaxID=2588326 RepID=A0AAN6PME2_9PEZI|nr:putative phospholipase A2 [Parachaetomium inaequale]